MNLLEFIENNLDGSKKEIIKKLLNKPWSASGLALDRYVPGELSKKFEQLRADSLKRLEGASKGSYLSAYWVNHGLEVNVFKKRFKQEGENGNALLWCDQIWAQVVEDLEECGYPSSSLSEDDSATLISLYTVAHACVSVISGLNIPLHVENRFFALERNPTAIESHKIYWFARYLSQQSLMSDHLLLISNIRILIGKGVQLKDAFHASSPLMLNSQDYFIDKYLSLHPEYLQLLKEQSLVSVLKRRLGLIVHLHIRLIWMQVEAPARLNSLRRDRLLPLTITRNDLEEARFSSTDIESLVEDCKASPVGERLLEESKSGMIQLGDISLKYALQKYCHLSMKTMERGPWFEDDYITNYFREKVPSEHYSVYKGLKDAAEKYDADLIIEDKRLGTLLFCQIKHRAITLQPHLRDELKEYSGNSEISKGLSQIKALRERISTQGVLQRVRQRIGNKKLTSQDLSSRARFLLIHTSESLDFCTSEGIGMYEWNTLRNLLASTPSLISMAGRQELSKEVPELDFGNVTETMQGYWKWLDEIMPVEQALNPSAQWEALCSSYLFFKMYAHLLWGKYKIRRNVSCQLSFPLF